MSATYHPAGNPIEQQVRELLRTYSIIMKAINQKTVAACNIIYSLYSYNVSVIPTNISKHT